jgi:hypothetical protein
MSMKHPFIATLASIGLQFATQAGGVYQTPDLKATYASQPITVDGKFTDWPEVQSSQLAPFKEISGRGYPTISKVFAQYPELIDSQAEVLLTHDADALYLGIRMRDDTPCVNTASTPAQWHTGGDGVVVHARTASGESFSLLWWGRDPAGAPRIAIGKANNTSWRDASALGGTAGIDIEAGKGCAVEIRLPWSAVGLSQGAPNHLDLVWEVAFSGIDRALLKTLPEEMRREMPIHSTYNMLTTSEKLASRGYLSRTQLWGTLRFGDSSVTPGTLQTSARGTGLGEWLVPQTDKALTIDGILDDWPTTWLLAATPSPWAYGDRYRTDMGICRDERNLCLAFRFRGGEPMFNTQIAEKQQGYLGGACIQIRLQIGSQKTNLCGWYDIKNGISALTADGKERKQPNLLAVGAQEAFTKLSAGRGYIQEISIPFKELASTPPKEGDEWKATFQLWWAGIDERFSVETAVDLARPAPLQTSYQLPYAADVSLGVFDQQGRLLRYLAKNESRSANTNVESWDGLDQWGELIPSGDYTLKGVYHKPLKIKYLMSAVNPGTPPWWTADGKGGWLSDEAAAQEAVTDGSIVYLAAPYAEAGHAIIAVGPDGKRIWGVNPSVGTPRCISLALLGDRLYAMFSGPELTAKVRHYKHGDKTAQGRAMILCFNRHTGELTGPSVKSGAPIQINTWTYRHDIRNLWDLRQNQSFSPATYGGQHRYCNTGMCETTNALGLTAVGNRLVASMLYSNELLVLDPDTFAVIKRIPLEAPAGLHGLDERHLLAVSGKRIVKLGVDAGLANPVISSGLSAPFGITTDRDGNLYVSDWGDSFQIKKFRADGRLLATIGRKGGRPWVGGWVADALSVPRGIAVTNDGKLWVAEDEFSPRRISVWNSDTGALIRDYVGPANYRGWGLTLDPRDPSRILTCGTEFKLDFERQTYTPVRKMFMRRGRNDIFTSGGNDMGGFTKLIYRNGREFLIDGNRKKIVIMERRGDEYRPVTAISGFEAGSTVDGTEKMFWDSDLRYHYLPNWYPEFFKGHAGDNHIWNDLNGDTVVQEDEVTWLDDTLGRGDSFKPGRIGELSTSWGLGFGPDWEIYVHGFCRDAATIYRLEPEFDSSGLPRYSFDRCRPIIHHPAKSKTPPVTNLYVSSSGRLFVTYRNKFRAGANQIAKEAIVCYDREGRKLWSIAGPHDRGPKSVYGYPNAEFSYPELGSGVVTWVWWHNGRAYLLTDDGLYLGGLLDNDLGSGPTFARIGGEMSSYASQTPDGRLILVNGSNSSHHFLEIQGLETARRFEQKLTITPADVVAAQRAQQAGEVTEPEKPVVFVQHLNQAPNTADWQLDRDGVQLATSRKPGRGGRIALKSDGTYLYLNARIQDETPMVNNGDNWQTPFITGDCVDLMLATDAKADPKRRRAVHGDLRLLFTELRGEPLAVLYRPVVPGAKHPVQMLAAVIDDVRRLPECKPVITREKGAYTLKARIPLKALGLQTLPSELRGDVGVIYGDVTGRDRDQRLYYYNQDTAMISDLSTEATLEPGQWGPLVFAKAGNLLKNSGFEEKLGEKASQTPYGVGNWVTGVSKNGATATTTREQVLAGTQALLLKQELPVKLPSKSYKKSGDYYRALNDGRGGGFVLLDQIVPVVAGQKYNLSFAFRAENMVTENRKRHGYSIFAVWLFWKNAKGQVATTWAWRSDRDQLTWQRVDNPRNSHVMIKGLPYTAPPEATHVQIRMQLTVNTNTLSNVYIDDVEFAPAPQ